MSKDAELCKWLRDNSSGSYMKNAYAAERIEQLTKWIEAEGERADICTQNILGKTCKDCKCAI